MLHINRIYKKEKERKRRNGESILYKVQKKVNTLIQRVTLSQLIAFCKTHYWRRRRSQLFLYFLSQTCNNFYPLLSFRPRKQRPNYWLFEPTSGRVAALRLSVRIPRGVAIVACAPLICIRPTWNVAVSSALPLCVFITVHLVYARVLIISVVEERAGFFRRGLSVTSNRLNLNGIK